VTVHYRDLEPNGLASMLGGLIQANLERDPSRRSLLRRATIAIGARDAEVAATIRLSPGSVAVANGVAVPKPDLLVVADSQDLLALSAAPLRFGLPDAAAPAGRALLGKLVRRRIRIRGLFRHPLVLGRLSRLLSVS